MRLVLIVLAALTLSGCSNGIFDVYSDRPEPGSLWYTPQAENGDYYNYDNDGDGRVEPNYVNGYYKRDGTYVRSHYRAAPSSGYKAYRAPSSHGRK